MNGVAPQPVMLGYSQWCGQTSDADLQLAVLGYTQRCWAINQMVQGPLLEWRPGNTSRRRLNPRHPSRRTIAWSC